MTTVIEVKRLAEELIAKHLETKWIVLFNNTIRQIGACNASGRYIQLSKAFLNNGLDFYKETILHEIAHAIDFERNGKFNGHGPIWKDIARSIGCKEVTASTSTAGQPKGKFTVLCSVDCGWSRQAYKLTKRVKEAQQGQTRCPECFNQTKVKEN